MGCIHVFAGIVAINIAENVFVLTNKGVCYGQAIQILERRTKYVNTLCKTNILILELKVTELLPFLSKSYSY